MKFEPGPLNARISILFIFDIVIRRADAEGNFGQETTIDKVKQYVPIEKEIKYPVTRSEIGVNFCTDILKS